MSSAPSWSWQRRCSLGISARSRSPTRSTPCSIGSWQSASAGPRPDAKAEWSASFEHRRLAACCACACRKSNPNILMMQPAQYRPTIDVPCPFNSARYLCLSADRTNQPFSISVLPRGARRCWSVANAHRSKSLTKSLGHFSFAQVAFEGDTLYETPVSSRKVAVNLLGVASPASAMPLSHPTLRLRLQGIMALCSSGARWRSWLGRGGLGNYGWSRVPGYHYG